ncbi:MAG: DUF2798 domain-containing protein [Culicoidibacterales bacterium]
MGKNRKEQLIFVTMICATMVFLMSCYNIALHAGFSLNVIKYAALGFIPAFIFALIGDLFLVGKIVKRIIPKIVAPTDPLKKRIIFMGLLTGTGMVLWMSLYGTIENVGFGPMFFPAYMQAVLLNFIVAIPLNLLIVSPIVRKVFWAMYPPVRA